MSDAERIEVAADRIVGVWSDMSALAGSLMHLRDRVPPPPPASSAMVNNVSGTTTVSWAVGLIGVCAIVVAVAAVWVIGAYADADRRLAKERHDDQRAWNEQARDDIDVLKARVDGMRQREAERTAEKVQ